MTGKKREIRKGTEFGGVGGIIQPPPHNPLDKPHEMAWGAVWTEPTDPEDTPEAAIERKLTE